MEQRSAVAESANVHLRHAVHLSSSVRSHLPRHGSGPCCSRCHDSFFLLFLFCFGSLSRSSRSSKDGRGKMRGRRETEREKESEKGERDGERERGRERSEGERETGGREKRERERAASRSSLFYFYFAFYFCTTVLFQWDFSLFQSFPREAIVSRSGKGRVVHSFTLSVWEGLS